MEENQSNRSIRWIEAKHELAMVCRNPILLTTILVVSALLIIFVIYPIFQVIRVSLTPKGSLVWIRIGIFYLSGGLGRHFVIAFY